jgi:glyoxylase-like metal-dependent hydrolase (beta-lactamase superfamily II)
MRLVKLTENVYFVEGNNKGRYPFCNSIFVNDSKKVLIDAGGGAELGELKPDIILNSHWHEDHIAYNSLFSSKVLLHKLDGEAVRSREEFKRRYGLPDEFINIFLSLFPTLKFGKVDEEFDEGYELECGEVSITALHTPGHSAGHTSFLIDDGHTRILYLGDIDLTSFGPWYGCLDCDIDEFISSVQRVCRLVDEEEVEIAVSSHRDAVRGSEEIKTELEKYVAVLFDREEKIRKYRSSARELVGRGIIYRRLPEPKEIFAHFEKIMLEKHLERMTRG